MITVIGAGYIGSFIADYLSENDDTVVIDRSEAALSNCRSARTIKGDARSAADIIRKSDSVVVSLPGNSARITLEYVANLGKNIIDISFMLDDPDLIGNISREKGAYYVPHCGYAPGLTNILAGSLIAEGYNDEIEIYCGGLPMKNENPLAYKVTWSAEGLIDEYTRKARFIRNGINVEVDPLEEVEQITIDEHGVFEAFFSDGLATLLKSREVRTISEKTLRYPGHIEKVRFMKEMGMFSDLEIGDMRVRDYTAKLLENLPGDAEDQCFLLVKGFNASGQSKTFTGYDRYDVREHRSAMCRMTGMTCASVALSLLDDPIQEKGTVTPESLGMDRKRLKSIVSRLRSIGITLTGEI